MSYPCSLRVVAFCLMLASVSGDDCFDCVPKDDLNNVVSSIPNLDAQKYDILKNVVPSMRNSDYLLHLSDDQQDEMLKDVVSSMEQEDDQKGFKKRHLFIIVPIGLFGVLCRWYLYRCCRCRRGVTVPCQNVQEVTVTVIPEIRQPSTSENITNHQNLKHQRPQLSQVTLPDPFQPIPLPAPDCLSSTQRTDPPPSYSEACAAQLPNKPFYK